MPHFGLPIRQRKADSHSPREGFSNDAFVFSDDIERWTKSPKMISYHKKDNKRKYEKKKPPSAI